MQSIAELRKQKGAGTRTPSTKGNPNAIIKNSPGRPTEYEENRVSLNFRVSEDLKNRLDNYCKKEQKGIAKVKVYCDIFDEFLQSKGY